MALEQLDALTDAISDRLVPYEILPIDVPHFKILLQSFKAQELEGLNMQLNGAQLEFPASFNMPGLNGVINAKVITCILV